MYSLSLWAFISEDQTECLLYYYSVLSQAAPPLNIIKLRGLDPDRDYHCDELDATFSATELMHSGFYVDPIIKGDFQSRRYYFKAK
jgi:alpha-galactosidase